MAGKGVRFFKEMRVLTLRLPDDDADKLEEVAQVKGLSVAEIMRRGVLEYVDKVRDEGDYDEQLLAKVDSLKQQAAELEARRPREPEPERSTSKALGQRGRRRPS
jgi:predicted transcriptional regulator